MAINVTERQLKKIIAESVKLIIKEALGAITNHMIQLAEEIVKRIKENDYFIEFSAEEINQYQNYYIAKKPLEIQLVNRLRKQNEICLQDSTKYKDTIFVNAKLLLSKTSLVSIIAHELTHLVNRNMSNDKLSIVSDFNEKQEIDLE